MVTKIMSVEDPPEWEVAVMDAFGETPDVILIQEIRQPSFRPSKGFRRHVRKLKASGAALPQVTRRPRPLFKQMKLGNAVMSTVHSADAIRVMDRLRDLGESTT